VSTFPREKQLSCKNLWKDLAMKTNAQVGKMGNLEIAALEVKQIHEQRLAARRKRVGEVAQELPHVEICLAANAK